MKFLPSNDGSGAVVSAIFVIPGLLVGIVVAAGSAFALVFVVQDLKQNRDVML